MRRRKEETGDKKQKETLFSLIIAALISAENEQEIVRIGNHTKKR
jgi:hypothetical protein